MPAELLRLIFRRSGFIRSGEGFVVVCGGQAVAALTAASMIAATGVGAIALAWAAIPVLLLALWAVAMLAPREARHHWIRLPAYREPFSSAEVPVDHRPPIH